MVLTEDFEKELLKIARVELLLSDLERLKDSIVLTESRHNLLKSDFTSLCTEAIKKIDERKSSIENDLLATLYHDQGDAGQLRIYQNTRTPSGAGNQVQDAEDETSSESTMAIGSRKPADAQAIIDKLADGIEFGLDKIGDGVWYTGYMIADAFTSVFKMKSR